MNNFQRLSQEQEDSFPQELEERKVSSTYYYFRHIGEVVDHFFGRALDMFVSFSGGEVGPKAPPNMGEEPFEDHPPMRY